MFDNIPVLNMLGRKKKDKSILTGFDLSNPFRAQNVEDIYLFIHNMNYMGEEGWKFKFSVKFKQGKTKGEHEFEVLGNFSDAIKKLEEFLEGLELSHRLMGVDVCVGEDD